LVRVLDVMPSNGDSAVQYLADFRAIAAAPCRCNARTVFWNESLTNPIACQSFGRSGQDGPETTGTALFTNGIAWGIRQGFLEVATYGPVLTRAGNGAFHHGPAAGTAFSVGFSHWVGALQFGRRRARSQRRSGFRGMRSRRVSVSE